MRMVKDEALAKDILQETFIKIWKNASKYNSQKAKIFTWMYQIAKNTALDKIRQRTKKSEREVQPDISNLSKIGIDPINPDTLDLPEILNKIDPKYQTVINALFYKGMTQQEASDDLKIPLGTVKTRLKIGLRELKKIFGSLIIFTFFIELNKFFN